MNILEVTTGQAKAVSKVLNILKDVLVTASIEFSMGSGIKIVKTNVDKTTLISVKLDAENFDKFVVKDNKLVIGVDLCELYALIEGVSHNEQLTFYIEESHKNDLNVRIDFLKNKTIESKIHLLDLVDPEITLPSVEFDALITMNSQEFYHMCNSLQQLAEYMDIECSNDKLKFYCKGKYGESTVTYSCGDNSCVNISTLGTKPIIKGLYQFNGITSFAPYADSSSEVNLYIKNEELLVIKNLIGTLGRVIVCTTHVIDNSTVDSDEEISNITI